MKVENGKLILEKAKCYICDGTGKKEKRIPCPNYGKAQKGKACPHCGSTTKNDHHYLDTGIIENCYLCNGSGKIAEDRYSFVPDEIWENLNFYVILSNRVLTNHESLLGIGAFSCVDYGRHKVLTDEQLIENVKKSGKGTQACKFTDKDLNVFSMAIITGDQGYSVVIIPKDKESIIKGCCGHGSKEKQFIIENTTKVF